MERWRLIFSRKDIKKNIALLNILVNQFFNWYAKMISAPMLAWLFIKSFGNNRIQGFEIVICALLFVASFTVVYFIYIYPYELMLGSKFNPEWNKLMDRVGNNDSDDKKV